MKTKMIALTLSVMMAGGPVLYAQRHIGHAKTANGKLASKPADEFNVFLRTFLADCFFDVNFNSLLANNDKRLAKYIDSQMDVRRYDSPGALVMLYARKDNFGFHEYTDYTFKVKGGKGWKVKGMPQDWEITGEEQPDAITGLPVIYYKPTTDIPEEMVDMENLITRPVELPYPKAKIMVAYLPQYFNGEYTGPRAFYFIKTPSGWKLAFVYDSLFSA